MHKSLTGAWLSGYSVHSFPTWRSAFKRVSVEIGRQVRLLCPWTSHLTGLPLSLSG